MNRFFLLIIFAILPFAISAQVINQNQQNVNINLPVIEKPVYIERYRTVYVERKPKELTEPVVLLGYLTVFPRDLGYYNSHPNQIISNINNQKLYGKNTWRLPTKEELIVMESYANTIGLSDDIYMANSHANGLLRLVSTGSNVSSVRDIESTGTAKIFNNLLWSVCNGIVDPSDKDAFFSFHSGQRAGNREAMLHLMGPVSYNRMEPGGVPMTLNEFYNSRIPSGWRLPTVQEFILTLAMAKCVMVDSELAGQPAILKFCEYTWGQNYTGSLEIPLDRTSGYFGSKRTVGMDAYYLVQEGVVHIKFSRAVENGVKGWVQLLSNAELQYVITSPNNISLNQSRDAKGYVRLVRDL
ncbi:MAG: hypothetical protein IKB97_05610 [Bacteroidaceae bacterium]|nr:hypothetical protein [Bacteroidaceae bacterium]